MEKHTKTKRIKKSKQHPADDIIAIDRLALMRYFASGLIAGGAGVTLTMLLSGVDIHPESFVALGVLDVFMTAGCIYFFYSAVKWMGLPASKMLQIISWAGLLYKIAASVLEHPSHTVHAFTGLWWGLVTRAFVAVIIGGALRYWAEMEINDLEYGLDHGLATISKPSKKQTLQSSKSDR